MGLADAGSLGKLHLRKLGSLAGGQKVLSKNPYGIRKIARWLVAGTRFTCIAPLRLSCHPEFLANQNGSILS